MRYFSIVALIVLLVSSPAFAQSERSTVRASNGVEVTVYADSFASRYEFSAPAVRSGDGFVLVARVNEGGRPGAVHLIGSVVYSGEWRFYDRAIFQGGAEASFRPNGRDVGTCSASRYSRGCSLTEGFVIDITLAQIRQHASNGNVAVQVRPSRSGEAIIFQVPVAYFDAVTEVSSRPN